MTNKIIKIVLILSLFLAYKAESKEPNSTSFITGVGSTHFEAHRMAYNAANAAGMTVRQQISRKSSDGLWHVIIKVSLK